MTAHRALQHHVDELAVEVGRLRRHPACEPETSLAFLTDRLADHVESLDCILSPSASELYAMHRDDGLDDDTAVTLALAEADRRSRTIRSTIGVRKTP